jgi:hypothetical protein
VLSELIAKKLLMPRIARHKLTVFDMNDLRASLEKLTEMLETEERASRN